MADRVGQQFGRYRLTHLIGRGGSAEVYLGEHTQVKGYKVAIKIVRGYMEDDKARDDFLHEARMLARLKHPYLTQLLDFDIQDNTPFIVMAYASGGNLALKHPIGERVPLDVVLHYIKQIGSALQHAHEQDIVHCDLKPNNLLIGSDKTILVSDFGFARLLRTASRSETSHRFGATLFYCAPEQFNHLPTTASDQYALGVIIYQWLSGKLPFDGTPQQLMSQHMRKLPPSLRNMFPDLAPQVEHVVFKVLSKEPQQRFATIQQFVAAFEEATRSALPPVQVSVSHAVASQELQTKSQMLKRTLAHKMSEPVPASLSHIPTSTQKKQSAQPLTTLKHTTSLQPLTFSTQRGVRINGKQIAALILGLFLLGGLLYIIMPFVEETRGFLGRATSHIQGIVVPSKDYQSSGNNGTTLSTCTSVVQVTISNKLFTIPNDGCSADVGESVTVIYDPRDPQGAKVEFGVQEKDVNGIFSIISVALLVIMGTCWLMNKVRDR